MYIYDLFQMIQSSYNWTQLNSFKYCYLTLIIQSSINDKKIELFYLTHRWNLTGATTLGQSGPESNGNGGVLHILWTVRLESHHQMQFDIIAWTLNGFKYSYLTLIILFNIIHLFAHSEMVSNIAIWY